MQRASFVKEAVLRISSRLRLISAIAEDAQSQNRSKAIALEQDGDLKEAMSVKNPCHGFPRGNIGEYSLLF